MKCMSTSVFQSVSGLATLGFTGVESFLSAHSHDSSWLRLIIIKQLLLTSDTNIARASETINPESRCILFNADSFSSQLLDLSVKHRMHLLESIRLRNRGFLPTFKFKRVRGCFLTTMETWLPREDREIILTLYEESMGG